MPTRMNILGERFGRLVVVEALPSKSSLSQWRCTCDCGGERVAAGKSLRSGNVASCGCLVKDIRSNFKHGMSKTPTYRIWKAMVRRCCSKTSPAYPNYGGRGITVCARWRRGDGVRSGFECFLADMGERPPTLTLERTNNDGNYDRVNCRWATRRDQSRNKRDNSKVEFRGCTYSWAELGEIGVASADLVRRRVTYLGWTVERAVFVPPLSAGPKKMVPAR